jgi:hypothetical protein
MSKKETPLTRRYWKEIGGTLIEEFSAVSLTPDHGKRLVDGVVILGAPNQIAKFNEVDVRNEDIVIIQTKAQRLGMYLLGQALFSKHLMKPFRPRSIKTVAVCTKGDSVLEPLAKRYGIKVVVYTM